MSVFVKNIQQTRRALLCIAGNFHMQFFNFIHNKALPKRLLELKPKGAPSRALFAMCHVYKYFYVFDVTDDGGALKAN